MPDVPRSSEPTVPSDVVAVCSTTGRDWSRVGRRVAAVFAADPLGSLRVRRIEDGVGDDLEALPVLLVSSRRSLLFTLVKAEAETFRHPFEEPLTGTPLARW